MGKFEYFLKDFIKENWEAFIQRCKEQSIDPEEVFHSLDTEGIRNG